MSIHPTAVVHESARIPESCEIGPFCVIGAEVELGQSCRLDSHVAIQGPTKIGGNNRFFPFCSIGMAPQDISYRGEPTRLEIGDDNEIREFVTINRGTVKGHGVTRVGSHILIMAYSHIAHDCIVGDHTMMANAATLAGHVTIEEWATVGAFSAVHQFCRVGAHAYIGGGSIVTRDVLPFSKTASERNVNAYRANAVGLQRRGFDETRIARINHAFKVLLTSKLNTTQALEKLRAEGDQGEDVAMMIRFIESAERGVIK